MGHIGPIRCSPSLSLALSSRQWVILRVRRFIRGRRGPRMCFQCACWPHCVSPWCSFPSCSKGSSPFLSSMAGPSMDMQADHMRSLQRIQSAGGGCGPRVSFALQTLDSRRRRGAAGAGPRQQQQLTHSSVSTQAHRAAYGTTMTTITTAEVDPLGQTTTTSKKSEVFEVVFCLGLSCAPSCAHPLEQH